MDAKTKQDTSHDVYLPWKLLQKGELVEALEVFRKKYEDTPTPGRQRGLGEALLWAGDYKLAAEHFRDAIVRNANASNLAYLATSEEDSALLGAAEWCVGDYGAAVEAWFAGLKAPYSIGGCRTHCPLLLFVASILRPHLIQRSRAEKLLVQRLRSARTNIWPGTLARFALGLIDQRAVEDSLPPSQPEDKLLSVNAQWLIDFYRMVRALVNEDITRVEFPHMMRSLLEGLHLGSRSIEEFYRITALPEFYIARHESMTANI